LSTNANGSLLMQRRGVSRTARYNSECEIFACERLENTALDEKNSHPVSHTNQSFGDILRGKNITGVVAFKR
jgi:hypothetical protein